jgi:type VI secretion system protein ImpM
MDATPATPGWYGKLPSTGDFASRRLPHETIEPWDTWLAEEIATLKEQSESWLNAYLESPTWRFVVPARWVTPGQTGVLAGVLMPSVDSVGRYFPLSIMAPLRAMPHSFTALQALLGWLHALDDLAADALQEDWPIEVLEGALARLPAPSFDEHSETDGALQIAQLARSERQMVSLSVPETRDGMIGEVGQALLHWAFMPGNAEVAPLGWWWCEPQATVQQRQLLISRGLPRGLDFATLLGSNHARHTATPELASALAAATPMLAPAPEQHTDITVPALSLAAATLTAPGQSIEEALGLSLNAGPFEDPLAAAFPAARTPATPVSTGMLTDDSDKTLPPLSATHAAPAASAVSPPKAPDVSAEPEATNEPVAPVTPTPPDPDQTIPKG